MLAAGLGKRPFTRQAAYGSNVQAHAAHTDNLNIVPCYCKSLELETGFWTSA